jgi:1-acyl-sn-glycerol-3-phosphate acyltransferase
MKRDPEPVRSWTWPHYHFARVMFFPTLFRLNGGYRVTGREFLPRRGPALIAANHLSYLDPPAVGSALPRRAYYFAKKELFTAPLFGRLIRSCYAFPVDREGDDKEAFRHAISLLKAGELLTVFPEGGRSADGSLQAGGRGAALIAARAGAPIIPCAIYGTDRVLPRHARYLHRGLIQVSFAPAIETRPSGDQDRATKLDLQAITDRVMSEIARLRDEQEAWRSQRGRR